MSQEFKQYQKAKFSGISEIKEAQTTMLRKHVLYLKQHSAAYRDILQEINPETIDLEQLFQLPFTEKEDIEKAPQSFLAVDHNEIADIVLSSGTTGKPNQIYYTEEDLKRLAYNEEQSFAAIGIEKSDIALLTCTMDRCFIAGLAYFLGMRALGAAVIRNGHGAIESHAELIRTLKPSIIVGVPSFLEKLGLAMQQTNQDPAASSIQKLVCIGEPLRGEDFQFLRIGENLESIWNAKAFSTYASSETITTFCECSQQKGGHLLPELAIVEIIDQEGRQLPAGEKGEVVMTPLAVQGMPLLRYKTGDISFLEESPCKCGRFSPRLGPILGRKKQLMKIKGTSLYPQAVFNALEAIKNVSDYYMEVWDDGELSDQLKVYVALDHNDMTPETLSKELSIQLRVRPEVIIEDQTAIKQKVFPPESRKPVRFYDKREVYSNL